MAVKISIGPLKIPALKFKKGLLLSLHLPWPLDITINVPPVDIQFWPELTLLPATTIFDPAWTEGIIKGMMTGIIEAVFNAVEPYLDGLARDFYARRGKEET